MVTYDAFISYSHAKDKPIADALQSVVQRLGRPWYRSRMLRVFRDDTSLSATPHLWPSIVDALDRSRYLILLASPEAASSHWVQRELDHWFQTKSSDNILIAVTDGWLDWDEAATDFRWNDQTPLPAIARKRFETEPKWVDLRAYRQGASRRDHHFIELAANFAAAIQEIPKEDLLSREVRQQRRALALAWSAASIMLALGVVSAWQWNTAVGEREVARSERQRAVAAQSQAERNYKAAKDTVDRLVFNITQQFRDTQGIRTETITRILDSVKTTVDRLIEQNPDDYDLQFSMSVMLDEFVKSYLAAGDSTRAFTLAKQSLALNRTVAEKQPSNHTATANYIQSITRLGDMYATAGDNGTAEKLFREAIDRRNEFIKAYPAEIGAEGAAANAVMRIGMLEFNSGRLDDAKLSFGEALSITEKLGPRADAFAQMAHAVTLMGLGDIEFGEGKIDPARDKMRRAIDGVRAIASRNPNNLLISSMVAITLGNLALVSLRIGDIDVANETYAEAKKLMTAHLERDPGNLSIRGYFLTFEKLWQSSAHPTSDAAAEDAASKKLVDDAREIAARDPANSDWQSNLASLLEAAGDKSLRAGKAEQAKQLFKEEFDITQQFVARTPDNQEWQRLHAFSLQKLADAMLQLNQKGDAETAFKRVKELAEQHLARSPSEVAWSRLLAVALERLGDIRVSSGDSLGALGAYQAEIAIAERVHLLDPADSDWTQILIYALNRSGDALMKAQRPVEAMERFQAWVDVAQKALELQPQNTQWLRSLAVAWERIGDASPAFGKPDETQAAFLKDIEAARKLVAVDQSNAEWNRVLAVGLDRLARVHLNTGKAPDAKPLLEEQIEICRRLLASKPNDNDWTWRLANALERLGDVQYGIDREGARIAFQEEADLARIARERYPDDNNWARMFILSMQRLGDAQFNGRDPDTARSTYNEALVAARQFLPRNPSKNQAQIDLILALWKDSDYKVRISDLARAHEQFSEAISIADRLLESKGLIQETWPSQLRERLAKVEASLAKAR